VVSLSNHALGDSFQSPDVQFRAKSVVRQAHHERFRRGISTSSPRTVL